MRLNQYLALSTGLSRRAADSMIAEQRVKINNEVALLGQSVNPNDQVTLDGKTIKLPVKTITIMLNKPVGYVCSREGQGSKTIYDLLPSEFRNLKPVGRLDKDSSGLILLTNDGKLAHELAHPSFEKTKVYKVELDKPLADKDKQRIEGGVALEDGSSKLELQTANSKLLAVRMHEGRNRQIRRTFEALGYKVMALNRIQFGEFSLNNLPPGEWHVL